MPELRSALNKERINLDLRLSQTEREKARLFLEQTETYLRPVVKVWDRLTIEQKRLVIEKCAVLRRILEIARRFDGNVV